MKHPVYVLLLFALGGCSASSMPLSRHEQFIPETATVHRIIDGDTLEVVLFDGSEETVRIIGIDTPEYKECYFEEATEYLQLLISDKNIVLQEQPGDDRDKYERLLRYIHIDGIDIGLQLITDGYARNYPWFDHPRVEQYSTLENRAKQLGLGLWSECEE
ncbi:hypothetical protein COU75_03585 [Candidatus Peregrinibacteria bacterium CG10_big_fil_rev_8_21_14_0_10_42_8]|nr:MAG: hypothetical protein COU75_03585 [Candidatus Peregrinibacteria bacterium CG10_big_fil_rev_8_21_14_0_10_42_8]